MEDEVGISNTISLFQLSLHYCYSLNMSYKLWTEKITVAQLQCTDDCLKEEEKKDWIYVQDNVEYSQPWLQASCMSLSSH